MPPAGAPDVPAAAARVVRPQRPHAAVAGNVATRTTSSCRRSCCSRRRSIACCRNTTNGSTNIPSFEALAEAPETRRHRDLVSARLQHPAEAAAGHRARGRRELRRQAAVGRSDAAVVQGHRRVHRGRHSQLRVPRARGDSRHERRARAVSRLHRTRARRRRTPPKKHLWSISAALVPQRRAFDFNQALMDFGATLCTARKPKCLICPMASLCAAYPYNPEHETTCLSAIVVVAAVIERERTISRRAAAEGTHLAGYWEFPGGKVHDGETHEAALRAGDRRKSWTPASSNCGKSFTPHTPIPNARWSCTSFAAS